MVTQTDIAVMKIKENSPKSMGGILKEIIDQHDTTAMEEGVNYYNNKNDILSRKQYYYTNGSKTIDETATNNRIPHNWHKLLLKQKMGYLVGKPITFSDLEANRDEVGNNSSPNKDFLSIINEHLNEKFDDVMNELVKGSGNKGVEWLHPYIDSNGDFGYTIIDARQFIPIWETQRQENLESGIRYYILTIDGEKRIRAEFWTANKVEYYLQDKDGNFVPDYTMDNHIKSHFYNVKELDGEVFETGLGWGQPPFIAFKNNEDMLSDLNDYKHLIDEYDKNRSDLANNLEDIQDVIYVLKNYAETSSEEFLTNLKYYKHIKVDGDGGVDTVTVEIPVDAKKEHTDRLRDDIYKFGMGVDIDTDKYGNSPSGVALKFLYSLLDLKCDTVERKFKKGIRKLLKFIALYYQFKDGIKYNHRAIVITFNRTMITNEAEKIESAQKSKNIISDETIVANHPWVDDPEKELERLEEQEAAADIFASRLDQELGGEVEL